MLRLGGCGLKKVYFEIARIYTEYSNDADTSRGGTPESTRNSRLRGIPEKAFGLAGGTAPNISGFLPDRRTFKRIKMVDLPKKTRIKDNLLKQVGQVAKLQNTAACRFTHGVAFTYSRPTHMRQYNMYSTRPA